MTTILRASRPAELLGLIPALAGYTPHRSLAVLPFEGARTYGAIRADLPSPDAALDEYVARVIGLVCRVPEADAVVFAVYDDNELGEEALPWAELIAALSGRAEACGIEVREALCVGADAWASYLGDGGGRHPLSEIPLPPTVPGLGDVSGTQHDGVTLAEADQAEAEAVASALGVLGPLLARRLEDGTAPKSIDPRAVEALEALDDVPAFFERMLETGERMPPYLCAALAWCLGTPMLRDVALVQWARDRQTGVLALGAQLAFLTGDAAAPERIARTLLGLGERPDPDRLHAALRRVRTVAALVPDEARVGPLVVAAWLSWALGRSTHAAEYIAQAQVIDPDHSMAALLATLVDSGALPEWAFEARDAT